MTEKEWSNLEEGNIIYNEELGHAKVSIVDDELCIISCAPDGTERGNAYWVLYQFHREDWRLIDE